MALDTEQIFDKARGVAAKYVGCDKDDIQPSTDLIATYKLDSLDVLDLGLEIEASFSIELSEATTTHLRTLEQIVNCVQAALQCAPVLSA